ncbi:MAG: LamG domain-containing protein [Duncaniella sp.]|nr:LamG domain-containing protein [Duncaniella sp.]
MAQYEEFIENPVEAYGEDWREHNGAEVQQFIEGKLRAHDALAPDDTLDKESDRPIQNRAVAAKFADIEDRTLNDVEPEVSEDGTTVTLNFKNREGGVITSATIPAGSGSSEGVTSPKLTITSTSAPGLVTRQEDPLVLAVAYDHVHVGGASNGQSTGVKAEIEVSVRSGSTVLWSTTLHDVAAGSTTSVTVPAGTLRTGDNDIYATATAKDPETGEAKTRQAYVRVKALLLALLTTFDMAAANASGGFMPSETIHIPYILSGAGSKVVRLLIDGKEHASATEGRSGITYGTFSVPATGSPLSALGRHNIQMVAEVEEGGVKVTSQSIYFDIWRTDALGNCDPHVCLMMTRADGHVFGQSDFMVPVIPAVQFETFAFWYTAFTPGPSQTRSAVTVSVAGLPDTALSADRGLQSFQSRSMTAGEVSVSVAVAGGSPRELLADIAPSSLGLAEATQGLVYKLDATGRSNAEADPAQWGASTSDGKRVSSSFTDVRFGTDGWDGHHLRLRNGGALAVGHRPFEGQGDMTLEITLRSGDNWDSAVPLVSCLDGGKGLRVTGDEIAYLTGETTSYTDADDPTAVHTREVKLSTAMVPDRWIKLALSFMRQADGTRLAELYVNGNRTCADILPASFSPAQATPAIMSFSSYGGDLDVRSVRFYNRALTSDEHVDNRIADEDTFEEMRRLHRLNDILDDMGEIDVTKILAQGKGVVQIIRKGKLEDVYATNDKKADFYADVIFTSPYGPAHSFILRNCLIRIQGTSSLFYPSKNLRIYFTKGTELLSFDGDMVVGGKSWPLRPGSTPVDLVCLKSDYVDSSMANNTGGARLFNDTMLALGLMTPPQRHQYEQSGGQLSAVTVRSAIDGYPVDLFVAETEEGPWEYMGQYNMNNEKSKSGKIFGMEGVDGFTPSCPLALEALNNSEKACLFQSESDEDVAANFDAGFEVNYGIDVDGNVKTDGDSTWDGNAAKGKTQLCEAARTAVLRLFNFIRACVPEGADPENLSTFVSADFRERAHEYMDVDYNLAYYHLMWRDARVDQLAKNIIWRTWEGLLWFATYYDGDTGLGERNDTFLKYLWNILRETMDEEAAKHAFEGFFSWMWNLLLANFADRLAAMAERISAALTAEGALAVYSGEQSGHWCDRAFNRSGDIKYIQPAMREMYGKKWNFIHALHGSNELHRTHFITNRYRLFDAIYGTSAHNADSINLYLARTEAQAPDTVGITAASHSTFGYGTNNRPGIAVTPLVDAGGEAELSIAETYTVNDPLRIYGASLIRSLDLTGACSHLKNGLDLSKCRQLESLDLSVPEGSEPSTGWFLLVSSCRGLRHLSLRGQTEARSSASSQVLDLSDLTRLETVDLRGCTGLRGVIFADGAPLTSVKLPAGLTSVTLRNHRALTTEGLTFEGVSSMVDFELSGCPGVDSHAIVQRVLTEAQGLRSFKCHDIDWTGMSLAMVERLASMKADITGHIEMAANARVGFASKLRMVEAWGNVDDEGGILRIQYTRSYLTSVGIGGARYISEPTPFDNPEKYRMNISATPSTGNDIVGFRWEMVPNPYATIDPETGVLDVTAIGSKADAPKVKVRLYVTTAGGGELTAEAEVGFYLRSPQVGDKVFADRTYSEIEDATKTVVCTCFWVDPNNPDTPGHRLGVACAPLGSAAWGLQSGDGSSNSFSEILLEDRPGYNAFDVPTIPNTGSSGLSGSYIDENSYLDPSTADGFKVIDPSTPVGQLGLVQLTEPLGQYNAYDYIPYGQFLTLNIIRHRDYVLSGVGLEIPTDKAGMSEMSHLNVLMGRAVSDNGGQGKYRQFYYPAASMCHAYEPSVKDGETLDPCFRAHNWFLPSVGELARLYWYKHADTDDAEVPSPLRIPRLQGYLTYPSSYTQSSNEYSQTYAWLVSFSAAHVNGSNKYNGYSVAAVVAF